MNSWKTTIAGVLGGVIYFVYSYLEALQAGTAFDTKDFIIGLLLAILGVLAKDFNVSGGKTVIAQKKEEPTDGRP